jgi:YkoP domain
MVTRMGTLTPPYRWLVASYDRVYRFLHSLDSSASEVGPAARIEVRRSHRTLHLADGTTIRRGDRIGVLHLNNDRVVALHAALPPIAVGLEFRRQLLVSLHALARLAGPGGWLSDVRAFEATTIFFHQWLGRLGFEADRDGLAWPGLVAAYQHALLASLRSAGPVRRGRATYRHAQRLWISREKLLAHYVACWDVGRMRRAPAHLMTPGRMPSTGA